LDRQAKAPTAQMLTMRVSDEFLKRIDDWRQQQAHQIVKPGRAAAVRHLTELGLSASRQEVKKGRATTSATS
jgi:hypothetical protein